MGVIDPPDVIRKQVLAIEDIAFTHAALGTNPDAVDTVMNYTLWDEVSEFTYLKETIVFTTTGTKIQSLVFDFQQMTGDFSEGIGWVAEPEHYDDTTTGVLATGWARWKNGWNEPVSIGNANLLRVSDGAGGYKYQIECKVASSDALLGVTFDILEIELNFNTEKP